MNIDNKSFSTTTAGKPVFNAVCVMKSFLPSSSISKYLLLILF